MGRLLRSSHKLMDQHSERPRGLGSHNKSLPRTSRPQIPTLAIRARLSLTSRWKTFLPIRCRPQYCHPSHRGPPPPRKTRNMVREWNLSISNFLNSLHYRRGRLPHTQTTIHKSKPNSTSTRPLMGTQNTHMGTNSKTVSQHTPLHAIRHINPMGQPTPMWTSPCHTTTSAAISSKTTQSKLPRTPPFSH
jgi:hypothetical protein